MENDLDVDESPKALHVLRFDTPYVPEIDDAAKENDDAKSRTDAPEIYAEDSNDDEPPTLSGDQVIGEESDAMLSGMAVPEISLGASIATSANAVRAIV